MSATLTAPGHVQGPGSNLPDYLPDPFSCNRFQSRVVMVGNVPIGGSHPIVLQSMTTADTLDTEAVVREAIAMHRAGSQIVRITAPGPKDAENLAVIKERIRSAGYDFPLVADIHFAPKAAMIAIEHVEKVRINPGNFVDSKKFRVREYDDESYAAELERLRDAFVPLVRRAKELGRALRIGSNHGSLSDRILNRYGDTPLGMVESAMEYLRIAVDLDYYDIILSMKASNPQVMIQAYRLLIQKFYQENIDFPLHLGVTEAGFGRDGRLKSAVGIGSLLLDGIGDTIRVSLTEDPVHELPPARKIAALAKRHSANVAPVAESTEWTKLKESYFRAIQPVSYERKRTCAAELCGLRIGNKEPVKILLPLPEDASAEALVPKLPDWIENGADALFVTRPYDAGELASSDSESSPNPESLSIPKLKAIQSIPICIQKRMTVSGDCKEFQTRLQAFAGNAASEKSGPGIWLHLDFTTAGIFKNKKNIIEIYPYLREALKAAEGKPWALSLELPAHTVAGYRLLVAIAERESWELPALILQTAPADDDELLYSSSAGLGSLLLDGIGDAVAVVPKPQKEFLNKANMLSNDKLLSFSTDLLQATRLRLSKTEFISCPSCGRTLFDLQSTTSRIQERTGHLKGVKIAVMGCIVNGPGEMADADFGYVGAGPGRVHLYREKELVKNNIPEERAVDELIELIREHGMWREPATPGAP